ncbi:MAG: translocation/assembly module TamB domain-containing protein [Bacteroidetes bacterium]|nr:translocation/assembly module TamB domain-containing protein [Bacteroidota bacterium]
MPERKHGWGKAVLRGFGLLVAALLVLVVVVLLLLQTGFGRNVVRNIAVGQIQNALAEGATVEIARLGGNLLTNAELTGVVIRQNGETTATIDTVRARYSLPALLRRTFSAGRIDVIGPVVFARQLPDSTFNLQYLLKPSDELDADSTASPFTVVIDSVLMERGRVEVHFYAPGRDSILVLDHIVLTASDFFAGDGRLEAQLHQLAAEAIAPNTAAHVHFTVAGSVSQEALSMDDLRLTSAAGTNVFGTARLTFAGGSLPDLTADLTAEPIAMADVRAFSGLDLYGNPRIRLTAHNENGRLTFAVRGAPHEGASIVLNGSLENTGRIRYQVEGQLRDVNPAMLTHNEGHTASLTGDLRLDLTGTSPRTLDGPFSVNLTDTRIGDQSFDLLRIDGAFRAGRLEFGLDADVHGARFHAEGDARPFDETPTYDISGEADDVNLARLLRDPSRTTSFSGSFSVNGAGIDPKTMRAEAIIDLQNIRVGGLALDYLDGVVELRQGGVRFVAESNLANGGGLIEVAGEARPFDDSLTYHITDGRVSHFNLAALTPPYGGAQESDLTGTFTLDGRGTDPSSLVANLTASLQDSRFGDYDLVEANFDGALERGLLSLDGWADLGRLGYVALTGTARPFDPVLSYDVNGRVEHLDLAELTDNPDRQSDISTAFTASGRGLDLASLTLEARLDLDYASYGAQEVTGGLLNLRLIQGNLTVEGSLEMPEGAFALDVSGRPFDPNPTLAFGERMCFRGVDLATLTGNPDLRTRLNGCFRGSLNGFDLATLAAEGSIALQASTFNGAEIESGNIELTLREGLVDADADLVLGSDGFGGAGFESGLFFHFDGRPFDDRPTYATNGSFTRVDLVALAGLEAEQPAPLTLDFDLEGAGLVFETMSLRGYLAAGRSKLGSITLDTLHVRFDLDRGRLALDTLLLRSDLADADGSGRITLTDQAGAEISDLAIIATLYDLSPLNAYTAKPLSLAEGELTLDITGEPGEPLSLNIKLAVQRFAYGSTALSAASSHLSGTFDPTSGELNLRNRLDFKFLSQPALLVERGSIDITFDGTEFTVEGDVRVDRKRSFDFLSRLEMGREERSTLIEQLNLNLDGEAWSLAQPARISIGEGYRFENFLLQAEDGTQQIAVDGLIDPEGEQAFIFTMEDFKAETVADLFGFEGLGGRFTTTLLMTGSARNPEISGTASLYDFTSDGEPVGSIDIRLDYADERLDLEARLDHISGKAMTVRGHVPLHFSLADVGDDGIPSITEAADADEVSLAIRADSFQVGWIEPFLNPRSYTDVAGILNADLTVDGTQADPQLKGRARLEDGRLGLGFTGRVLETLSASIRFIGNQVIIRSAVLTDADGNERMTAEGVVTLQKLSLGELDIRLVPHRLLAMETPTYDGLVIDQGADTLRLTGTLANPVIRGHPILGPADINLTDELITRELEDVRLSAADLRIVESRFGRRITARDTSVSRFYRSLDLNVDVEIGRDVWLRSRSGLLPFAAEFSGNVQAVKAPLAEQTSLFGTVDITRGWVETLSRRFDIERGTLIFNGLMEETLVDLEAKLDIRTDPEVGTTAVEIGLLVNGRLGDNLTITLSSNPQLDNADIVSLIVTGQLAENVIGGGALAGAGEGFFLGQLSGIVEGLGNSLGESIGFNLDVVRIDQTPDGLVIRLGKYLTNKAFISFGMPLSTGGDNLLRQNNPELTLEYALIRWLLVQLEYQNGLGGGLIYEYAY